VSEAIKTRQADSKAVVIPVQFAKSPFLFYSSDSSLEVSQSSLIPQHLHSEPPPFSSVKEKPSFVGKIGFHEFEIIRVERVEVKRRKAKVRAILRGGLLPMQTFEILREMSLLTARLAISSS